MGLPAHLPLDERRKKSFPKLAVGLSKNLAELAHEFDRLVFWKFGQDGIPEHDIPDHYNGIGFLDDGSCRSSARLEEAPMAATPLASAAALLAISLGGHC